MKRLILFLLITLSYLSVKAQIHPLNPIPLPQNSMFLEPSTGLRWGNNGAARGWYRIDTINNIYISNQFKFTGSIPSQPLNLMLDTIWNGSSAVAVMMFDSVTHSLRYYPKRLFGATYTANNGLLDTVISGTHTFQLGGLLTKNTNIVTNEHQLTFNYHQTGSPGNTASTSIANGGVHIVNSHGVNLILGDPSSNSAINVASGVSTFNDRLVSTSTIEINNTGSTGANLEWYDDNIHATAQWHASLVSPGSLQFLSAGFAVNGSITLLGSNSGDIQDGNGKLFVKATGTNLQYIKGDGSLGTYAAGGSGTMTSITPGVGFLSHTPITSSGTMDIDTASTIVTKSFAGRYITAASTNTLINKSGNISQWTNDSGYVLGTRNVSTGLGLSGGGNLTADRTIIADTTVLKSKAGFLTDYNNLSTRINAKGVGTVTSIATGLGLSGGTITGTGTLIADTTILKSKAGFLTDYNNLSTRINLKLAISDTSAMAFVHLAKNEAVTGQKTFSKAGIFQQNGIATTLTDGLYLQNNIASTVSVTRQLSPSQHFGARVWNTTATAADNWADWVNYADVTSGTTPTTTLTWSSSRTTTSTPSYTMRMGLDNSGNLWLPSAASTFTVGTTPAGYNQISSTGTGLVITSSGASATLFQPTGASTAFTGTVINAYTNTVAGTGFYIANFKTGSGGAVSQSAVRGDGMVTGRTFVATGTATAINSTATVTAAQLNGGVLTSTSAAATTMTLPTATQMATQIGAVQGYSFEFTIDNTAGANTVTVALGAGMTQLSTITGANTLTVPSGTAGVGVFRLYFSSTTACTFSRIE